jgi:hypothetical protein
MMLARRMIGGAANASDQIGREKVFPPRLSRDP